MEILFPTIIINNKNKDFYFYSNNGSYFIDKNISFFKESKFFLYIKKNIIQGDYFYYDYNKDYGYIKNNIFIFNKKNKLYILGDYVKIQKKSKIFTIRGNIFLVKKFLNDKIFITSDKINYKILDDYSFLLNAYSNSKIFFNKKYLKCNLFIYKEKEDYISCYKNPKMFISNNNIIIGDIIRIFFNKKNKLISSIEINKNAFIINKQINNINQLKGEKILIYFINNDIKKLLFNGNTEIQFNNYKFYCDNLELFINNKKIYKSLYKNINFYKKNINDIINYDNNIFIESINDYNIFIKNIPYIYKCLKIQEINNININNLKFFFKIE